MSALTILGQAFSVPQSKPRAIGMMRGKTKERNKSLSFTFFTAGNSVNSPFLLHRRVHHALRNKNETLLDSAFYFIC